MSVQTELVAMAVLTIRNDTTSDQVYIQHPNIISITDIEYNTKMIGTKIPGSNFTLSQYIGTYPEDGVTITAEMDVSRADVFWESNTYYNSSGFGLFNDFHNFIRNSQRDNDLMSIQSSGSFTIIGYITKFTYSNTISPWIYKWSITIHRFLDLDTLKNTSMIEPVTFKTASKSFFQRMIDAVHKVANNIKSVTDQMKKALDKYVNDPLQKMSQLTTEASNLVNIAMEPANMITDSINNVADFTQNSVTNIINSIGNIKQGILDMELSFQHTYSALVVDTIDETPSDFSEFAGVWSNKTIIQEHSHPLTQDEGLALIEGIAQTTKALYSGIDALQSIGSIYTVKQDDTLQSIAATQCNDISLWTVIRDINNISEVEPGMLLMLPVC